MYAMVRAVMALLTVARLARIMPRAPDVAVWADVLEGAMRAFDIDTPLRAAAFLAQVAHESGELRALVENLNYSAAGLRATWPARFTSDAMARRYARQPERIANYVYANRLGNAGVASGDGWRFRGRGLLQVTGRSNYRSTGEALGLPLEDEPERLEEPEAAALSAGLVWRSRGLNELSDLSGDRIDDAEDFVQITRRLNGGTAGLTSRKAYWAVAKTVLLGPST
jgi:putative chitinase